MSGHLLGDEWLSGRTRHSDGSGCAGTSCGSTRSARRVSNSVELSPRSWSTIAPLSSVVAIYFPPSINSPRYVSAAITPRHAPSRWARIGCARAATSSATHLIRTIRGTEANDEGRPHPGPQAPSPFAQPRRLVRWLPLAVHRRAVSPTLAATERLKADLRENPDFIGAPEGIRTPDPQIRSLVLYPAELPAQLQEKGGAPEEIRTPDPQIRSLIIFNSLTFLHRP